MTPPPGFQVSVDDSECRITYKSKGMFVGSISLTMATLFTSGLFFGIPENLFGGEAEHIRSKVWFPVAITLFYLSVLYGFFSVSWKLFGVIEYNLSPEIFTLRRKLFFFSLSRSIVAGSIQRIDQVKDGGGEEDSFPSWGLNLYAQAKMKLLAREPIDKSDWLGAELANYYNVEYEPSRLRE